MVTVTKCWNLWHVFFTLHKFVLHFSARWCNYLNRFLTSTWLIRTKSWHHAPTKYNVLSPTNIYMYEQYVKLNPLFVWYFSFVGFPHLTETEAHHGWNFYFWSLSISMIVENFHFEILGYFLKLNISSPTFHKFCFKCTLWIRKGIAGVGEMGWISTQFSRGSQWTSDGG